MGHIRLGVWPAGRRWEQVVGLLRLGGSVEDLAAATAHAAERELESAKSDPAFAQTIWLLTQLPLAARSPNFAAKLAGLGFDPGSEQTVLGLIAGFTNAVDRHAAAGEGLTDLGELARQAAAESLSAVLGSGTGSLFETDAESLRKDLERLATKAQFAGLARDFFARLTQKTLEYYISRALPDHVGPDRGFTTIDEQIAFRGALERHCYEAALIVEDFAGGWYSKNNYRGTLTAQSAQAFAAYALQKMRDELRARRASDD